MVSIYKNENASIKIKKFETLFKEKLFSFLLNFDVNPLNSTGMNLYFILAYFILLFTA